MHPCYPMDPFPLSYTYKIDNSAIFAETRWTSSHSPSNHPEYTPYGITSLQTQAPAQNHKLSPGAHLRQDKETRQAKIPIAIANSHSSQPLALDLG